MKFKTRRLFDGIIRLMGRSPADYAQELEEKINQLWQEVTFGIPAGFNGITPTTIQAGVAGAAGAENSGWMSASATIPVETGTPIGLSNANGEGGGTALMRSSALIKRDVRIFVDGVEFRTRNALDLVGLVVTDDAANDRVRISASGGAAGPSAQELTDLETRAAFDSLALREMISRTYR